MGDPRRQRKKYQTPVHPWSAISIQENRVLRRNFGLGKKKEILIAQSFLKKYKNLAKQLIARETAQGTKEKAQILGKLQRLGLLPTGAELDSILDLTVEDVLSRRLQSVLHKQGLARTMKQARQFIVHRHVLVAGKEITTPGYLVSLQEEAALSFKGASSLANEEHPERAIAQKEEPQAEEKLVEEKKAAPKKEAAAKEDKKAVKKEEKSSAAKEPKKTEEAAE